jgi:restriction system protein
MESDPFDYFERLKAILMIPNYQQFMRPFLEIAQNANGKEVKLRDVINQLADKFNLTEGERAQTLPSGNQPTLDNRVGWAKTYLLISLKIRKGHRN